MNNRRKIYMVDKKTLITIADIVWCMAGFNVLRLGILAYGKIELRFLYPIVSVAVFTIFGEMFIFMSKKHIKRIITTEELYSPFWNFFDLKSYLTMLFMMSGGIWLRASDFVPKSFIACFYSGLGFALILAALSFLNFSFVALKKV
ncbi:hypothetical protein LQU94_00260 [Peptoniphilus sp. KCTC 25270]|uniref:hypothetical protein n=1 Tax=Peptoniphilus sp. KCTC 25270 TaxID=2897414 RepID=UPI001E43F1A7|nr:hypothetical protein [Peptoniphilus sp. KCTC 25270]MCD1146547.1 hypothetical protein [Peptoniphilus sp. KCTC 25270]